RHPRQIIKLLRAFPGESPPLQRPPVTARLPLEGQPGKMLRAVPGGASGRAGGRSGTAMSVQQIQQRLAAANERLERARQAARARWRPPERAEYWAAQDAVLVLERELAAAKGEEHAVPLDFPVEWDAGCPRPHLLCNDYKA